MHGSKHKWNFISGSIIVVGELMMSLGIRCSFLPANTNRQIGKVMKKK